MMKIEERKARRAAGLPLPEDDAATTAEEPATYGALILELVGDVRDHIAAARTADDTAVRDGHLERALAVVDTMALAAPGIDAVLRLATRKAKGK